LFNQAIETELNTLENNPYAKSNFIDSARVEFYEFEKENGKAIRDCVEKFGVHLQWTLNFDLQTDPSCAGSELTFLTNPRQSHCIHSWISPHHRSKFYQQCLGKFDINAVRKQAIFATRNLEYVAFKFKNEMKDKGAHRVGGGSAMIAGGILGGVGLLLPATGPVGIILVVVGTALGFAGSITTIFGQDSSASIATANRQMIQLKDTHDSISNLLVLYGETTQSIENLENKFVVMRQELMDRIETNYGVLFNTVVDGGKLVKSANDLTKLKEGAKSTIFSKIIDKIISKSEKIKNFKMLLKSKIDIISKTRLGKAISQLAPTGSFIKYATPVFDIGVGIFEVIQGTKQMTPSFNHQIMATSRAISKEIDDLIETYYKLLGDDVPEPQQNRLGDLHNIYSVGVEVASGNWDSYSGVYFEFDNGKRRCNTKGSGYQSLSAGWVTLNISNSNFGECLNFEFFQSNLSVSVIHYQNSHLLDRVTIDTIQVSVDGNFLPSFEVDTRITVGSGERSEFYHFKPVKILKAIKTHTSQVWNSGTDADVQISLNLDGEVSPFFPLDKLNDDDMEWGKTDIYKGTTLNLGNQLIRDYVDFYPESAEIKITFRMTDRGWAPDWNPDLVKLYFTGKTGENVVVRCMKGAQWITSAQDRVFTCTRLGGSNPAKSIEMFEAHICDSYFAPSNSDQMKLKFCRRQDQFRSFNESDCCRTNLFSFGSNSRNTWKKYDAIHRSDVLDGGEVLGHCEGFHLPGTKIYAGNFVGLW